MYQLARFIPVLYLLTGLFNFVAYTKNENGSVFLVPFYLTDNKDPI